MRLINIRTLLEPDSIRGLFAVQEQQGAGRAFGGPMRQAIRRKVVVTRPQGYAFGKAKLTFQDKAFLIGRVNM